MPHALLQRTLSALLVALGVSLLAFLMIHLIPGDAAEIIAGTTDTDPARLATIRAQLGLDRPLPLQYLHWLAAALHGDLGRSISTGTPVLEEILPRLAVTAELTLLALALATLLALPLGCLMAATRGRTPDLLARLLTVIGITTPAFWLGTLLLYAASALFPGGDLLGWVPFADDPAAHLRRLVLPALALALPALAAAARLLRAAMIEALREDYCRTAHAKGRSPLAVTAIHAGRNALLPFVTGLGILTGYLFGGSVVVEQVFAIPGLGRLMLGAIAERNYPLVQASILLATLAFVAVNALVDALCIAADPRLR